MTAPGPVTLGAVASQVRSKNAGPFWLTIDVFLPDDGTYARVAAAPAIRPDAIGRLYAVDPAAVKVFHLPELQAVKISFPRPVGQGSPQDRDIHSGQQFVPLLDVDIP